MEWKKKVWTIAFTLLLFVSFSWGQERALFEFNRSLGKGVNLGNVFEAPDEQAWGNPFKNEFIPKIKEAGFDHVRVPIRWDTQARCLLQSPYTITPAFLERIKLVVDLALQNKLKVIINMHHHDDIFVNPAQVKPRFLAQWQQIAAYFKDYPKDVIFEVMNEPHDQLTPALWNVYFADALTEIRKTNPNRVVLMGVAEFGGIGGLSKLVPPQDSNVIATIHYYNPFNFTHQGAEWVGAQANEWLGTPWNDLDAERAAVRQEFAAVKLFEQTYDIPIHIGEFGAYSKADQASRLRWSTFMARYIESLGYSWAYWEWSAGFGVYDPVTGAFKQELIDALVKNTLPDPTKTILTTIYESNFASSSGWSFFTSNGASGTMGVGDNLLNININRAGSAGWHAQLVRNGFSIYKGKMYKLSFEAKSNTKLPVSFYMGKASDPWNGYSGFSTVQLTNEYQEYSNIFTMTSPTDLAARMVFDLGSQAGDATFRKVKLEEVTLDFSSNTQTLNDDQILLYPNPVNNQLVVAGLGSGLTKIDVLDQSGKLLLHRESIGDSIELSVHSLPSGTYICRVVKGDLISNHRFIKQ